jgi:hypothetical protein
LAAGSEVDVADCQAIVDELAGLKKERADLQEDLHGHPGEPKPSPSQKAAIAAQIKEVTQKIEQKEQELRDCLGVPAPLPAVTCPMADSTATLITSNASFPGPFLLSVVPTLTFLSPDHAVVTLAPITNTFGPIPISGTPCMDMLTVTIPAAGGTFNPTTGDLSISVSATLSHSLSGGILNACSLYPAGPSVVASPLTTGTLPSPVSGTVSGAPLSRTTGALSLVASGTFTGGLSQVAGTGVDLRITGTLGCAPLP